jgi:hypothetical protein
LLKGGVLRLQPLVKKNLIPVLLIAVLFVSSCGSLPSDDKLSKNFFAHNSTLESLRMMAEQDHLSGRIGSNYCDPHLSAGRLQQYRELMRQAGVMRIYASGDGKPLEFTADATGWLDVGEYKGYEYRIANAEPEAASLNESCFKDSKPTNGDRFCSASKRLADG